jgi:ribulose 1,5-bisphosphate synthetase/thiazole synthase
MLRRSFCSSTKTIIRRTIQGNQVKSEEISVNRSPKLLSSSSVENIDEIYQSDYDVIIVGAGHNGLICANYLAKEGKKVLILEKRHEVGYFSV